MSATTSFKLFWVSSTAESSPRKAPPEACMNQSDDATKSDDDATNLRNDDAEQHDARQYDTSKLIFLYY
jgi:hypothetical protein